MRVFFCVRATFTLYKFILRHINPHTHAYIQAKRDSTTSCAVRLFKKYLTRFLASLGAAVV